MTIKDKEQHQIILHRISKRGKLQINRSLFHLILTMYGRILYANTNE